MKYFNDLDGQLSSSEDSIAEETEPEDAHNAGKSGTESKLEKTTEEQQSKVGKRN